MNGAFAAIVAGAVSGNLGSGVSSLTWSQAIAAGSNRMLVVRLASINSNINVVSVTYGGVALTYLADAVDRNSTTAAHATIYYLLAPATGTANVVLTMTASARVVAGSSSFTGVSQANPFGTISTASGNSKTPSVTVAGSISDMFIDMTAAQGDNGGGFTPGAGQTGISGTTGPAAADASGMSSTKAGAASTTMGWTFTNSAAWVSIGVPLHAAGPTISGTVFEDVNYGGGAGRSRVASGGTVVDAATVELYNSVGTYLASTVTAADGSYSFSDVSGGNNTVRVVNSTVASQRSGATAALRGVMTYRTTATSGTAVAVTDYVGGTNPALVDPGAASSGAGFNTSTGVFSAGLSGTAQSFAVVTVGSSDIAGVDFGFNFDTLVNTNDTGQGSLRQAITNANTLTGDAALAQSGRTAGIENLIFMLPNGTASGGLQAGFNAFSAVGGRSQVATIAPLSVLPTLLTPMVVDAQTQPGWSAGTGYPIIELNAAGAGNNNGIALQSPTGNVTLRGFIVNRAQVEGIKVLSGSGDGNTIQGCWSGTNSAGGADSTYANKGSGINLASGNSHVVGGLTSAQRNIVGARTTYDGISVTAGGGHSIIGNYIGVGPTGLALAGGTRFGILIWGSGNNTITDNVVANQGGSAVVIQISSGNVIQSNIIGADPTGVTAMPNAGDGVSLATSNNQVGGTVSGDGNLIRASSGAGVILMGNVSGNAIRGNSIYGNTGLGIDLKADGVTVNSGLKTAGQPNLLMNTPVFTTAALSGTNLAVAGYVGSAAGQSVFASSRVEIFISSSDSSGYGEGQTYLGFLTADASGNFSGTLAGVTGVTIGSSAVTGTATDTSSNTSEFGPNFLVTGPAPAVGRFNAFETATAANALTGVIKTKIAGQAFTLDIVAINSGGTAYASAALSPITVELLDSSNSTGALNATTNCNSTWTSVSTQTTTFSMAVGDAGRKSLAMTLAAAYPNLRVRITWGSIVGCSTDNFALRPGSFVALQATDGTDSTTGSTRVLNNASASGGAVHRAGRGFSVLARAVNADGTTTAINYAGTAVLGVSACTLPVGCSAGTLASSLAAASGVVAGTATYAEAGAISVTLTDTTYANVDSADSSIAERYITSSAATFGRFVADAYLLSANAPTFAAPTCNSSGSQANVYVGQPFAFATVPVITATPVNSSGVALANDRPSFGAGAVTSTLAASGANATFSGTPTIASVTASSTAVITFAAGAFSFTRTPTPVASFAPTFTLTVTLADTTETATSGNSTIIQQNTLNLTPIAFSNGATTFDYGRLQLRPTVGDYRSNLVVPLEVQTYTGTGWTTLTASASCLSIPALDFAYSSPTGVLNDGGGNFTCVSRISAAVTTSGGRASLALPRPAASATSQPSAMTLTLDVLSPATGGSCTAGGAATSATTLAMPWLASPAGTNPSARVTWGRNRASFVSLREMFN